MIKTLLLSLFVAGWITVDCRAAVPTLDTLAAGWMQTSDLLNQPSLNNFSGGLKTETNLLGVTFLTFAPYSQGSDTAVLSVNGSAMSAQQSRWFPYQVERSADSPGLHVDTIVRMPFEQQGVLFSITVQNTSTQTQTPVVSVALRGYIRNISGAWSWSSPRPGTTGFSSALSGTGNNVLVVNDTQSAAATAFAFATPPSSLATSGTEEGVAQWTPTLAAGQSVTLQFVLAVGSNSTAAAATATNWAGSFSDFYTQAQSLWEQRWESAFQPGNSNFSGSAPVLDTTDAALQQVYYTGVLTAMLLERTGLPQSPRAYVTAGPEWAVTLEYFWDTAMWSDLWAQLDPAIMKAHCEQYLAMNIHSCYAKDYLSGSPAGPWYAPNDVSVFGLWWSYLTATGDWAALNDTVNGSTVLQQLNGIAVYWKSLVPSGSTLADYGGNGNLLECDSNYIHQVASLNAGNVWMMRRMGDIYTHLGQTSNAAAMYSDAAALAPKVLALYNGDGTWNCNQNGTVVNIRHIYDYIMLGRCMSEDLSSTIQTQMTSFVQNELLVPNWMRAMSLSDPAANFANSQRPDHGPIGSYDGWPAMTCGVMAKFGQYNAAHSLLAQCQGVLQESSFSQAHQLLPASNHVGVVVNDYPALNPTSAITVEAWINASAWEASYWQGSIVSKDDWAGANHGYVLRCGNNGCLSFCVAVGGAFPEAISGPVMSLNGWHHVAGTYDGTAVRVYVDGVQQASTATSGSLSPSAYPLMVGRATYVTGRNFIGAIDGPRVYGRALSASEISAQVALGGSYASSDTNSLALYLPLNDSSGTTATNLAAGGINGALFDPTEWTTGREGSAISIPFSSTNPNNVYPRVATSGGQDCNEGCGAAFANSILTGLFGFSPSADGSFKLASPTSVRGFTGTLSGLHYRGVTYNIASGASGLSATSVPLTWNATPGTSAPQDGGGTWDASTSDWYTGQSNIAWSDTNAENAIFGAGSGTAGVVTINGARTIGGLTFNPAGSGNYVITGGTLSLSGSAVIAANADATISSALADSAQIFTKSGAGTLTLSGTNSYTGPTFVNGGTLRIMGSSAGSAVTVNSGGTLSGVGTTGAVTVSAGGTLSPGAGGTGSLNLNGNALSLAGATAMTVNAATGTGSQVQGISTVTYGGTLTVTNLGGSFSAGNSFTLFNAGTYSGSFVNIVTPPLPDTLQWDASKLAVSGTIAVTQTPWGQWLSQNFTTAQLSDPAISGDAATPNGDGTPNLLKYALGIGPWSGAALPIASDVETIAGSRYLRLTVARNPADSDISYTVEVTNDLSAGSWSSQNTTIEVNTGSTLVVRDNTPVGSVANRFIRLKVVHP